MFILLFTCKGTPPIDKENVPDMGREWTDGRVSEILGATMPEPVRLALV